MSNLLPTTAPGLSSIEKGANDTGEVISPDDNRMNNYESPNLEDQTAQSPDYLDSNPEIGGGNAVWFAGGTASGKKPSAGDIVNNEGAEAASIAGRSRASYAKSVGDSTFQHMSVRTMSLIKKEEEIFYNAPENEHGDDSIWGLLSGVGGNIYEWYDFAVYGLLAAEIGKSFFPESSSMMQLINSFGVYLAAFLMRPLGAILFGEMGDRVVGRKNALVMSILLITIPSVAMGLLPTYEMIGPIAPILLVILRMMQGLSVGGQLAGSYVLSIEQSTTLNRGFRGSICDASSVGGFLLASLVTTSVRSVFSAETVIAWAWRVPFWFSLALAPLLYHIVSHTEESKFWEERKDQEKAEKIVREEEEVQTPAFIDLFSSPFRRRQLAGMIGVLSAVSSSFYMLFLWTPLYLSNLRGLVSEQFADFMTVLVVSTYIVTLIFMGKLSDKFPHRMDLIRIGLPGIIVAAPVMFTMFESDSILGIFIGQIQFAICLAVVQGGMAAWEVELWMADPSLSFTGVAIGHNLASTIFGGTMPLVATALFYKSVEISSGEEDLFDLISHSLPALYLSFLGCVSLTSLSFVVRHPHDVRTGEKKIRNAMSLERKRARARIRKDTAALEESGASSGGFFSFFKK